MVVLKFIIIEESFFNLKLLCGSLNLVFYVVSIFERVILVVQYYIHGLNKLRE